VSTSSKVVFQTFRIILAADAKAKNLTVDEFRCLELYVSKTLERGGVFISEWKRYLESAFESERQRAAAFRGLIDKGILRHELLEEDIRHMGGGSTVSLSLEVLERL